ncbi:MAG: hypothetical protein ACI97Y_000561, partial [Pseudomonadales bacterium]
ELDIKCGTRSGFVFCKPELTQQRVKGLQQSAAELVTL